jgi:hypothetical protein
LHPAIAADLPVAPCLSGKGRDEAMARSGKAARIGFAAPQISLASSGAPAEKPRFDPTERYCDHVRHVFERIVGAAGDKPS